MQTFTTTYQAASVALSQIKAVLMAISDNEPVVDALSSISVKADFAKLQALFTNNQPLPDPIAAPAQASNAVLLKGLKSFVSTLHHVIGFAVLESKTGEPLYAVDSYLLLFKGIAGYYSKFGDKPTEETLNIFKKEKYKTFAMFRQDLDRYGARTGYTFVIDKTEGVKTKKSMCTDCQLEELCSSCKAKPEGEPTHLVKVLRCQLHKETQVDTGKPASTGPAKKQTKSSNSLIDGCKAFLRVKIKLYYQQGRLREELETKVCTVHHVHTHLPSLPDANKELTLHLEMMRVIDRLMDVNHCNTRLVNSLQAFYSTLSPAQKQAIWRHVYRARENRGDINGATEVERALEHIRQAGGTSRISWAQENGIAIPHIISWVTAAQRELAKWGVLDVLAMDATYSILKCGMPVIQVAVKTASKNIVPIFQAVIFDEMTLTYELVLDHIIHFYGKQFKSIFTDADSSLANALRNRLPKVPHLLCRFHKAGNLTTVVAKIKQGSDEHTQVVQGLCDLGLAAHSNLDKTTKLDFLDACKEAFSALLRIDNIDRYEHIKQQFLNVFPANIKKGIEKILATDKQFAFAHTKNIRTLGWTTSSAAESVHAALKHYIRSHTNKTRKSIDEFAKLSCAYTNQSIQNILCRFSVEGRAQLQWVPKEFAQAMQGRLTTYLKTEILAMYTKKDSWTAVANGSSGWVVNYDEFKVHVSVTDDKWNCSCFWQQQFGLVCVHIVAARQSMYPSDVNKWLLPSDIATRWLIPIQHTTNATALQEEQEQIDEDGSVDTISSTLNTIENGIRNLPANVQPIMLQAVMAYFNNEVSAHSSIARDPLTNVRVGTAKPKGQPRGKTNTLKAVKPRAVQVVEQAEKEDRQDARKIQRTVKRRHV